MEAALVLKILNMLQAGIAYLGARGLHKDRVQAMLDAAGDGDLTEDQVQAELDALQDELDLTDDMIDDMSEDDEEPT